MSHEQAIRKSKQKTVVPDLKKCRYRPCHVTTTASPKKRELLLQLGSDEVVDYSKDAFDTFVEANKNTFDIILDCVGDAAKCVPLLKPGGSMTSIQAGRSQSTLTDWVAQNKLAQDGKIMKMVPEFLNSRMGHLVGLFGGGWRMSKACEDKNAHFKSVIATGNGEKLEIIAKELAEGLLKPVIDSVFKLSQALHAIHYHRAGRLGKIGKVVIEIASAEDSKTAEETQ